jgi:hypothetical protein
MDKNSPYKGYTGLFSQVEGGILGKKKDISRDPLFISGLK